MAESNNTTPDLSLYKKVSMPDKEALSDLVLRAKGPYRTMVQFAQECGTSGSTLSRIVNMKNRGGSDPELMAAIAAHADVESGVTLDRMMEANGMSMSEPDHAIYKQADSDIAKHIIVQNLFDRGFRIMAGEIVPVGSDSPAFVVQTNAMLELAPDALQNYDVTANWAFDIYNPTEPSALGLTVQVLTQAVNASSCECYPYARYSYVTADENLYAEIRNTKLNATLKNEFSVILIDLTSNRVVDEIVFPCDGAPCKKVFSE